MGSLLDRFPEILRYGATGLSALLFFFAYLLLRQQNQKDKPDESMLQMIKTYMYVSVGLAIISLASTSIDGYVKYNQATSESSIEDKKMYSVVGTVEKTDLQSPRDIAIIARFPILFPSPEGEIVGLRVWKGPDGKFPILSFSHPDYQVQPIDLNRKDDVEINDDGLHIVEPIKLLPIPGGG